MALVQQNKNKGPASNKTVGSEIVKRKMPNIGQMTAAQMRRHVSETFRGMDEKQREAHIAFIMKAASNAMLRSGVSDVFPDRVVVKMRYTTYYTSAPGIPLKEYIMRASPYDPDYSGAGSQPVGFDQWCAFYTNFVVLKASSRTRVNSSTASSLVLCLFPAIGADTIGSFQEASGQAHARITTQGGLNAPPGEVSVELDLPTFYGRTREEYIAEQYFWGSSAGDPTYCVHWRNYMATLDGTNVTLSHLHDVEFEVMFFDRVQVNNS